jgi:hypothetical protein
MKVPVVRLKLRVHLLTDLDPVLVRNKNSNQDMPCSMAKPSTSPTVSTTSLRQRRPPCDV